MMTTKIGHQTLSTRFEDIVFTPVVVQFGQSESNEISQLCCSFCSSLFLVLYSTIQSCQYHFFILFTLKLFETIHFEQPELVHYFSRISYKNLGLNCVPRVHDLSQYSVAIMLLSMLPVRTTDFDFPYTCSNIRSQYSHLFRGQRAT